MLLVLSSFLLSHWHFLLNNFNSFKKKNYDYEGQLNRGRNHPWSKKHLILARAVWEWGEKANNCFSPFPSTVVKTYPIFIFQFVLVLFPKKGLWSCKILSLFIFLALQVQIRDRKFLLGMSRTLGQIPFVLFGNTTLLFVAMFLLMSNFSYSRRSY